jgi:hypothetical protein
MSTVVPLLLGLAALVLALGVVLAAVTGRANVRSCCAVPAERDLRLRDASRTGEIV